MSRRMCNVFFDPEWTDVERPDFLPEDWFVAEVVDGKENFIGYVTKGMAVIPWVDNGWALVKADRYVPKGPPIQIYQPDQLPAAIMAGVLLQ